MTTHDNKHLSLDERKIIQTGIENRASKISIARTIAKDPTTVAKEIKKHRKLKPRNTFNNKTVCKFRFNCNLKCFDKACPNYCEEVCSFRDRSPGACNKCISIDKCRLDKYFYYATDAQKEYKHDLSDFRSGFDLTTNQRKELASILKPLLDQGQSIYQILSAHPEIKQSDKTIYNYIDAGLFKEDGIDYFSLKEKVQRKHSKSKLKKRREPVNYDNHKYIDYLHFKDNYPDVPTTQMDTVLNSNSGPYIQTFYFDKIKILIGRLHHHKTSEYMANELDTLEKQLGSVLFKELFSLLLTDRGTEFQKPELFEVNTSTGEVRLNIFYCDPQQSQQKPQIENNHNYIRDIIPNEVDISNIKQEDLDLMFSHINSTPRKIYNGKTPIEILKFFYEDDFELIMKAFNLKEIKRDEVILKPYLLKHIYKK
ncbi:IS30 family transposase [Bacilli bacterium PM5-3]|nr:IS30 family transposase [Bacilli bacterium PM5-3]MDH6604360.1 IS30 family transposase [Bacilli bacterium PM5-9]